jgi:Trk-type K+ transport system membrane component
MMGWLGGIIAIAALVLLVLGAVGEQRQWEQFVQDHNCKVVAKMSSTFGTGFSTSGNVTTVVVNGKTSYLCDDGVTYTR